MLCDGAAAAHAFVRGANTASHVILLTLLIAACICRVSIGEGAGFRGKGGVISVTCVEDLQDTGNSLCPPRDALWSFRLYG